MAGSKQRRIFLFSFNFTEKMKKIVQNITYMALYKGVRAAVAQQGHFLNEMLCILSAGGAAKLEVKKNCT